MADEENEEEAAAAALALKATKDALARAAVVEEEREARLAEAHGAREAREHELDQAQHLLTEAQVELGRRPAPLVPGERPVDVAALREATSRLERAAATLAKSVDGVLAAVPPEP